MEYLVVLEIATIKNLIKQSRKILKFKVFQRTETRTMVSIYSISEKNTFLKLYYAGNSLRKVRDLFGGFYPDRPIPSISSIKSVIDNQNKYGSVFNPCKSCKRLHVDNEDEHAGGENINETNVIGLVTNDPHISTRQLSSELNIHHTTALKILKKHKFKSYKYSNHQELFEVDRYSRMAFCEKIMEMSNTDNHFLETICFSDETTFTINGEPNVQNYRYWDTDNPRLAIDNHSQYPQKLNVWAGILGSRIIGPFFIEGSLDSNKYLELLQNQIGPAISNYGRNNVIWFQQDGCPAHSSRNVTAYLNDCFNGTWIGRYGPVKWPARSPDLSPNDFFLWGHLKSKIYGKRHPDIASLRNKIIEVCGNITERQLANVRRTFYDRLGYCLAENGGLFEHLL